MRDLKIIDIEKIKKENRGSFGQVHQIYPVYERYYKISAFNTENKLMENGKLCYIIASDNTVLEYLYKDEIEIYSQVLENLYVPKLFEDTKEKSLLKVNKKSEM